MSSEPVSPAPFRADESKFDSASESAEYDLGDDGFLPGAMRADPLEDAAPARPAAEAPVRDHVLLALKAMTWLVFAIFAWAFLSWSWHFLAPGDWHYLAPSQIDKLQNILLVAIISAVVTIATRRIL